MRVPYYKNNELQPHFFEISDAIWKGCTSKYQKVAAKNMDKLWLRAEFYHPELFALTVHHEKGFVATCEQGVAESLDTSLTS